MKKTKLLCALSVVAAASLTSCGGKKRNDNNIDNTKAQLTISTFDGGVGDEWLKKAADIFCQKNKDRTDFEEGKIGCQIQIKRERFGGDSMLNSSLTQDIYFTENVDYYRLTNQGKFEDITDILVAQNPEDGNKTILSKINPSLSSFLKRDNKYYAVPFYDCIYGLVYDKDLFKEREFYMTDGGDFTSNPAEFGTGPNGIAGDWDDGLPKTYKQFKEMMEQMVLKDVTPFVYSNNNQVSRYASRGLMSYWSDDEGYEDTLLNYTFNGTAQHIVSSITAGEPAVTSEVITKETGKDLKKQAGIYNALKFAETVLCSDVENYKPSADNTSAQTEFVNAKDYGGSVKPIAMMFEGTWWENEAVSAFELARSNRNEFNYGLMAIPKSDDAKVGQDATFLNLNNSYGFINANSKQKMLAKEFFQFVHTDEQLKQFTMTTSMTRGLDYTLSSEELTHITSFAKDLVAIKQSEHARLLYPVSDQPFFIDHPEVFDSEEWIWGGINNNNPVTTLIAGLGTADSMFAAHYNQELNWDTIIV